MKSVWRFIVSSLVAGALVLAPLYLAMLLLLHAANSAMELVKPISRLLPDWLPDAKILAFAFVVLLSFLIGVFVRTRLGQMARDRIESSVFERIPGYGLFRSLTQQIAGTNEQNVWKPALVEIEQALVPAFVIEELDNGHFTIFVPSVPTPFAGTVYVMEAARVHLLDVPMTTALKSISRWGSGAKDLVAAMRPK